MNRMKVTGGDAGVSSSWTLAPFLDERQRRLQLGAEARALGHGGIRLVARAARVREATVALGVGDLEGEALPPGRARRPGGRRRQSACLDPGLVPALLALVEPEERGDPVSPLRWTVKSTRALAAELSAQGHRSLPARWPACCAGRGSACRPTPRSWRGARTRTGTPSSAISAGRPQGGMAAGSRGQRRRHKDGNCRRVRQHRPAVAAPGGPGPGPRPRLRLRRRREGDPVRDLRPGRERRLGQRRHRPRHRRVRRGDHPPLAERPRPPRLPRRRPAPGHRQRRGANGYRTRAWKTAWPRSPSNRPRNHLCHFPPGTSKSNKIEHRLFSHITMNWRGRPLTSHEVVVSSIAATTTRTRPHRPRRTRPRQLPHRAGRHRRRDGRPPASPATTGTATGTTPCAPSPPPGPPPLRGPPPRRTPPSPAWNPRNGTSSSTALHAAACEPPPIHLSLADQALITILRLRYRITNAALAALYAVYPSTIKTAQDHAWPLLVHAGTPPNPPDPASRPSPSSPPTPAATASPSHQKQTGYFYAAAESRRRLDMRLGIACGYG